MSKNNKRTPQKSKRSRTNNPYCFRQVLTEEIENAFDWADGQSWKGKGR